MRTWTIAFLVFAFGGTASAWPNDETACKLGIETDCIIDGAQDYVQKPQPKHAGANYFKYGCDRNVEAACIALACSKKGTCQNAAILNQLEPLCETKKSAPACAVLAILGPDYGHWIKQACLLGGVGQCTGAVREADDAKELREVLRAGCETYLFESSSGILYCTQNLGFAEKRGVDDEIKRLKKHLCEIKTTDCEKFAKRLRAKGFKAGADRTVTQCLWSVTHCTPP